MIKYRPTGQSLHMDYRGRNWYRCEHRVSKLSKRGNDVYRFKIRTKFKPLGDLCTVSEKHPFLTGRTDKCNILFLTLTYNPKLKSMTDAWHDIGTDYNLFITKMRQQYGNIKVLRCFEAMPTSGYPHIHAILCFDDHNFIVNKKLAKRDNKHHYQVSNTSLQSIQDKWHSYVLVEGVRNMGAFGYLLKYIQKDMFTKDKYKTISKLWFHHKRSHDVSTDLTTWLSHKLQTVVVQLDTIMSNSNNTSSTWTYLCTINANKDHEKWNFTLLEPPPFEEPEKCHQIDEYKEYRRAFMELI